MNFPIVVHKDKKSDFGVTVPDLPGCFSAGETLDEAIANAKEAIECHLEGMMEDGEPIPEQAEIEKHRRNPDYKGGIWGVVSVDLSKLSVKAKRVNITMPERLLKVVDAYAKQRGDTRSGLLTRAVQEFMGKH